MRKTQLAFLAMFLVVILFIPKLSLASFDVNLKYGSTGSAVIELQNFLTSEGFLSNKPDGKFGLITLKAVKAFQTAQGLKADGFFGNNSRSKAQALLGTTSTSSNTGEQTETGTANTSTGCTLNSKFNTITGQPCLVNTPIIPIIQPTTPVLSQNPITSTPIDYSIFQKIQESQYANNPSAYYGQKIEFVASVVSFLPKNGSIGSKNFIILLDPIANTKVAAEVDNDNSYTTLVNTVKAGDTFRAYGIGIESQSFSNSFGVATNVSTINLSAADDCTDGSSVTNLTSDSSPYGWACAGIMAHVFP